MLRCSVSKVNGKPEVSFILLIDSNTCSIYFENIILKNGKKLEWSVETTESIIGKKINLDLQMFKETYTIDKSKYFI